MAEEKMKIRYGIIGSGFRAEMYMRLAKKMPDTFEVTSVLVRNDEKVQHIQNTFGLPVTKSGKVFLASRPDFVVDAVSKDNGFKVLSEYVHKSIPVLTETPSGLTVSQLQKVWQYLQKGAKIQTAEQYQFYPYYKKLIELCRSGIIGDVQSALLSCVHDYHAASIGRLLLGVKGKTFSVFGRTYTHPIVETDSRYGWITDGRIADKQRSSITIEFDGNKQLFYEFSPVQYRSRIRSSSVIVYGERGEIHTKNILYVTQDNSVHAEEIHWDVPKDCTEDDVAVSYCLRGMKKYVETGEEFYPMREALEDAYISILMSNAVQTGKTVHSKPQVWEQF